MDKISWSEILVNLLTNINSTAVKAVISSGGLDYLKLTRNHMLFEFNLISQLTKELEIVKNNLEPSKSIKTSLLNNLGNIKLSRRRSAGEYN